MQCAAAWGPPDQGATGLLVLAGFQVDGNESNRKRLFSQDQKKIFPKSQHVNKNRAEFLQINGAPPKKSVGKSANHRDFFGFFLGGGRVTKSRICPDLPSTGPVFFFFRFFSGEFASEKDHRFQRFNSLRKTVGWTATMVSLSPRRLL